MFLNRAKTASATFGGLSGIYLPRPIVFRDEMAMIEALRTQLDNLRLENQKLEVENARLREEHPEGAVQIDAEEETHRWQAEAARYQAESESRAAEAARLGQLYEQLLRDTQALQEEQQQKDARISELTGELGRQNEHGRELERNYADLTAELQRTNERTELECHRAVAEERRKWEAREERSVQQLLELQKRLEAAQAQTRDERDANSRTGIDGERSPSKDDGAGDRESTAGASPKAASLRSVGIPQLDLGESDKREVREIAGSRCESPAHTGNASAQPRLSQRVSTSAVDVTVAPPTHTGNASAQPRPSQDNSTSAVDGTAAPPTSTGNATAASRRAPPNAILLPL